MELIKQENYCIFEKKICKFANNKGNCFECKAKSDEEMLCRKQGKKMWTDYLDKLETTGSLNSKVEILKEAIQDPDFCFIVESVYDYHKKYFVKDIDISPSIASKYHIADFRILLDKLSSRTITGNEAKDTVANFLLETSENEAKWFFRTIQRDLRCGFGLDLLIKAGLKSIPVFEVMLATNGKNSKKLTEILAGGAYVSRKLDGYRCLSIVDNSSVILYSRNGNAYENFPSIESSLVEISKQNNLRIVLDGEIMSDDFSSMQQSAFANKRGTAVGDVKYNIFDAIPFDEWESKNFKTKTSERLKLKESVKVMAANFPNLAIVEHQAVNSLEQVLQLEREFIIAGYEGAMLLPNIPYYCGRSSNKLMKFKTMKSMDCKITGFVHGNNKYEGVLGNVIVEQENGISCEVGSGFKDEDRSYIWGKQDEFLGKMIEVKYQELTDDKRMRFPVFIRFRNDK